MVSLSTQGDRGCLRKLSFYAEIGMCQVQFTLAFDPTSCLSCIFSVNSWTSIGISVPTQDSERSAAARPFHTGQIRRIRFGLGVPLLKDVLHRLLIF